MQRCKGVNKFGPLKVENPPIFTIEAGAAMGRYVYYTTRAVPTQAEAVSGDAVLFLLAQKRSREPERGGSQLKDPDRHSFSNFKT